MSRRTRSESRRAAREEAKRAAREEPRAGVGAGSRSPSSAERTRPPASGSNDVFRMVASAIFLFGLLAYHRSFGNPFVFDDIRSIQENPTIRSLSREMFNPPVPRAVTNRPVVNASFALNYAIGGLEVGSFHVLNLLIHMGAALLLFGIVRRTLELPSLRERFPGDDASWIAGAIALLWLVHPLAGESVTYVVQRTESLMGFFWLLVLYCVIRGATGDRPSAWYAAALVALGLGLGSKEPMVAAPLAVLAYDRIFLAPSLREALRRRAFFYGAIVAAVLLVLATTRTGTAARRLLLTHLAGGSSDYAGYLLTQCEAVVHYLRLSFWPWPIAGDYDDWPRVRTLAQSWPALVLVLSLAAATAWGLWRRAAIAYLGVWFFLAILPTAIVPLHAEIVADRRMYLPLAAVVALCVFAGHAAIGRLLPGEERGLERWRAGAAVTLALAVVLSGVTILRTLDFASGEAFWSRVVSTRPMARRGRINLGYYTLWSGRLDEAIAHFETAVANDRADKQAHFGLAGALQRAGRSDDAIREYRRAIALDRRYAKARWNLAELLAAKGITGEADWHRRVARNPRLVPKTWTPAKQGGGKGGGKTPGRGPSGGAARPAARPPGKPVAKPGTPVAPRPWRPPLATPPPASPSWARAVVPSAAPPPGWRPPLRRDPAPSGAPRRGPSAPKGPPVAPPAAAPARN